jgi:ketosteroid isomerase-like protein
MSEANVEIVRRLWAHFGETGDPDFSILDREVEIHDHDVPDAPVYRGHDGYVRWMEDWGSAWAQYTAEPEEFIDAGDRVVVFVRMTATGRGSGVTLARKDAQVFELGTKRSFVATTSTTEPKPSKPPGCRSSRFGREAAATVPNTIKALKKAPLAVVRVEIGVL